MGGINRENQYKYRIETLEKKLREYEQTRILPKAVDLSKIKFNPPELRERVETINYKSK